jgi:hypothetical protein
MYKGDWMVELARVYQEKRLREAENARLLAQARQVDPTQAVQSRLLSNSGDVFISFGRWLKQHAEPGIETTLMLPSASMEQAPCDN